MAEYTSNSPYFNTKIINNKLDLLNVRSFRFLQNDLTYEIEAVYKYRPDLLAHDLYNKADLWWVFATRNPDILVDPIFDFQIGITIYLPQLDILVADLGI